MAKKRNSIQVNNIADLRRHALNTLDMLVCGEIEVEDAHAASELYKDVMGTLKVEVDYCKAIGKPKEIAFFSGEETKTQVIEVEQVRKLEDKWRGD
jgi:cellulase/cellobiase CelA1